MDPKRVPVRRLISFLKAMQTSQKAPSQGPQLANLCPQRVSWKLAWCHLAASLFLLFYISHCTRPDIQPVIRSIQLPVGCGLSHVPSMRYKSTSLLLRTAFLCNGNDGKCHVLCIGFLCISKLKNYKPFNEI